MFERVLWRPLARMVVTRSKRQVTVGADGIGGGVGGPAAAAVTVTVEQVTTTTARKPRKRAAPAKDQENGQEPPKTPQRRKIKLEASDIEPIPKLGLQEGGFNPKGSFTPLPAEAIEGYIDEFRKGLEYVVKVDPSLADVILEAPFGQFLKSEVEGDITGAFQHLSRGIMAQQVSGAAAYSIFKRFVKLFHDEVPEGKELLMFPKPQDVVDKTFDELRSAGLSNRKTEYITGLAKAFAAGEITDQMLREDEDDEVVDRLVSYKGLGPWSADMFLLFYLHRMNVFSVGDLGVQRGLAAYIKGRPWLEKELQTVDLSECMDAVHSPGKSSKARDRKLAKLPKQSKNGKWKVYDRDVMDWIAHQFQPYRSVFQLILWRLSSIDMEILDNKVKDSPNEGSQDKPQPAENKANEDLWNKQL